MGNLRTRAVDDAKRLNIRDWGDVIEFTDPDGNKYNIDAVTGKTLKAVQILYDYRKFDPSTGMEIIVSEPVVTMARSSLSRVPEAGERWHLRFPIDTGSDTLADFVLTETRAPEGGRSLGLIRFYPQKAKQI